MVRGAKISAVAQSAGGAAAGHAVFDSGSQRGSGHAGDRAGDEQWVPRNSPRKTFRRNSTHISDAARSGRHSRLQRISGKAGTDTGRAFGYTGNLSDGAAFLWRASARSGSERY